MLRILIADDHDIVRRGLRSLFQSHPDWEVCGEASGGAEAVARAAELRPDVAIVDAMMPDLDGLAATRRIREVAPRTEVCVFTTRETDELVAAVLSAGARGFVLKTDPSRHMVAAVEALARHASFLTPTLADALVSRFHRPRDLRAPGASPLTAREREVVCLLACGYGNRAVATSLGISVKTVESHRAHVMRKLEIESVVELVRYAVRNRLIELESVVGRRARNLGRTRVDPGIRWMASAGAVRRSEARSIGTLPTRGTRGEGAVRILVAENHEVVRRGLKELLSGHEGWEVVGEARTGRHAVELAKGLKPDVVVLALSLPELPGVEAIRLIRSALPNVRVAVFTMHEDEGFVSEAIAAGARAYVLKSEAGARLLEAVEALQRDEPYFTPKAAGLLMNALLRARDGDGHPEAGAEPLTQREREVAQLLVEGLGTRTVAARLGISTKTVDTHRSGIMRKLGLSSMAELVRYAVRHRMVEP